MTVFRQEILGTFIKMDPNEIALDQFREWMRSKGIRWTFENDHRQPTTNIWINFPDGGIHTFKRHWDAMSVTHEDYWPQWRWYVYVDKTDRVFFQRKLCVHCNDPFDQHADGKCLFGATSFEVNVMDRLLRART